MRTGRCCFAGLTRTSPSMRTVDSSGASDKAPGPASEDSGRCALAFTTSWVVPWASRSGKKDMVFETLLHGPATRLSSGGDDGGRTDTDRSGRIQPARTTRWPACWAVSAPQLWVRAAYGAGTCVSCEHGEGVCVCAWGADVPQWACEWRTTAGGGWADGLSRASVRKPTRGHGMAVREGVNITCTRLSIFLWLSASGQSSWRGARAFLPSPAFELREAL
jgi:hypothetical protein